MSIIYNLIDTSPECVDGADIQTLGCHSRLSGNDSKSLRPAERLMHRIKTGDDAMPWPELQHWVIDYYEQLLVRMDPRHAPGMLKKWLGMMRTAYPEAETLHRMLRTERDPSVVGKILAACQA